MECVHSRCVNGQKCDTERETWRAGLVKRNSSCQATGSQNSPLSPPPCLVLRDLARGWKSRIFVGYLQAAYVGLFLHHRCSEKCSVFCLQVSFFRTSSDDSSGVLMTASNRIAAASTRQYTKRKVLLKERPHGSPGFICLHLVFHHKRSCFA